MSFVCHALASVHCCLVVICWERADLLTLVSDVKLCFCHFPMWYPESGVVLDCIDSRSLQPFLLCGSHQKSEFIHTWMLVKIWLGVYFT